METTKVNAQEFARKYVGVPMPQDIARAIEDAIVCGNGFAQIRVSAIGEMDALAFYAAHPELRPNTNWDTLACARKVIDVMKRTIAGETFADWELSELVKDIGITIDGRKVKGQPTADLDALYQDALWLRCNVQPQTTPEP